jgi:hypothetical protein
MSQYDEKNHEDELVIVPPEGIAPEMIIDDDLELLAGAAMPSTTCAWSSCAK